MSSWKGSGHRHVSIHVTMTGFRSLLSICHYKPILIIVLPLMLVTNCSKLYLSSYGKV